MIDRNRIVAEDLSLDYLREIEHCDSFIDVGAYHGLYSLIVGRLYDTVDIYSFEPNTDNRRVLTQITELNGVDTDIRAEIVSDSSGSIEFYERNDAGAQGHSTTSHEDAKKSIKNSIALSNFFVEEEITDPYLKLDAEGEEFNLLRDVLTCESLSSLRGIVEVHPDKMDGDENSIVELFDENGYGWEYLGDTTVEHSSPRPAYYFYRQLK